MKTFKNKLIGAVAVMPFLYTLYVGREFVFLFFLFLVSVIVGFVFLGLFIYGLGELLNK